MQCIIMENTLIKLTHYDETKKRAHASQIVRAKEIINQTSFGAQDHMSILAAVSVLNNTPKIKHSWNQRANELWSRYIKMEMLKRLFR